MPTALNYVFGARLFTSHEQFTATQTALVSRVLRKSALPEHSAHLVSVVEIWKSLYRRRLVFTTHGRYPSRDYSKGLVKGQKYLMHYTHSAFGAPFGHVEAVEWDGQKLLYLRDPQSNRVPGTGFCFETYLKRAQEHKLEYFVDLYKYYNPKH